MVIIAVNRKTRFYFLNNAGRQLIGVQMSPTVIDQMPAIPRPVGRFNNVVKFLEDGSDAGVDIHRFQNAE